ncbi:protocadherin [Blastopirellula marina]|nr:protocadherin [Blastopirellula marina]
MIRQRLTWTVTFGLILAISYSQCWARGGFGGGGGRGGFGGGGGGFSGGARGGMGGGGFSGGGGFNRGAGGLGGGGNFGGLGGAGGINRGAGGLGGGAGNFGGLGGGGGLDRGVGGLGGGAGNFGGLGGGGLDRGAGNFGGLGAGGAGGLDRGAGNFGGLGGAGLNGKAPSRGQLNNFLGLPSDEGLHNLGTNVNHNSWDGNNFDVNHGSVDGPRGGAAAGTTVTGPRDNTVGRGAAVGPNGGAVAGRGFEGAGGAAGGQAIGRGPNGGVAAGGAIRGPNGGAAARGAVVGPHGGAAAGFARVSPSGRYNCAVAVRGNFNHWGVYGHGWYTNHPGAWFAAGWTAGYCWRAATWNSLDSWMGYYPVAPVYYDYGNTVVYQDDGVYVNGQNAGTPQQYYDQASTLATDGADASASKEGDWLPLGVFALTKTGETTSDVTIQLAINKQGIIRGNYTDTKTDKTQVIQGSADKKTQRVAFTVGDNTTNVVETGLYNLTKDEAPALIHFGTEKTEQWLLVRLKNPDDSGADADSNSNSDPLSE